MEIVEINANDETNLQLICCPIGSPNTEVGVGRANVNLATLWLSWILLTSLNSLKFSGSKHPVTAYQGLNSLSLDSIIYKEREKEKDQLKSKTGRKENVYKHVSAKQSPGNSVEMYWVSPLLTNQQDLKIKNDYQWS